jgi:hypothetical protein
MDIPFAGARRLPRCGAHRQERRVNIYHTKKVDTDARPTFPFQQTVFSNTDKGFFDVSAGLRRDHLFCGPLAGPGGGTLIASQSPTMEQQPKMSHSFSRSKSSDKRNLMTF